jgi:hypothetical protein
MPALGLWLAARTPGRDAAVTSGTSPQAASVISLIAAPTRHEGMSVAVVGVGRFDFEGTALYLHREDYDKRIATNAIWLEISEDARRDHKRELDGRYVSVEGTFSSGFRGFRALYAGAIRVQRIVLLPELAEGARAQSGANRLRPLPQSSYYAPKAGRFLREGSKRGH